MSRPQTILRDERGQIFVGYIVAILMIMLVTASVMNLVRRNRVNTDKRVFQDQALELARQGFEEGLSYFRRQPSGVYLQDTPDKPQNQLWITPWPIYPDSAFAPQAVDTDHWTKLSFTANTNLSGPSSAILSQKAGARALIRTFPLLSVSSVTTTSELTVSPVWGRFVLRRQNARNWSPGPNTMAAFSDPEAVHDLTHIRTKGTPGSGNYWSIFSRGYVMANQTGATVTAAFENPAMFEGGNLISAPKRSYNNKPLLLATASVYGELYRINFKDQGAAAWVSAGASVACNTNGIINGLSGNGVAKADNFTPAVSGFVGGAQAWVNVNQIPSVSNVFPGMNTKLLYNLADRKGGDVSIFPAANSVTLSAIASSTTFYYVSSSAHFLGGLGTNVMTGVGMVFVQGDLTFDPGNLSTWTGIVYVTGNCTVNAPVTLDGCLMVMGKLTVAGTGINKAEVTYNQDALNSVASYLQRFQVDKNSILTTFN